MQPIKNELPLSAFALPFALFLFTLISNSALAAISSIEKRGAFYEVLDDAGAKTATLPASIGSMVGWGADYFIVKRPAGSTFWYDLYSESGRKYKTLASSIGEIRNVSSASFVVRRLAGSTAWLDTYDKAGNKTATRAE
jgi:hypothetical protein